jgi:serine/threonine protein kinase/tetratricopeptide (TPR) repeat protein
MNQGILVPGYTLHHIIGKGATSVVYKASSTVDNRDVALKILTPESAGDADIVKQFRLEYRSMSSLQHRNIVRVFAEGEEKGLPYFSMEYVGGYSAGQWLERKGRLDEKDIVLTAESCMLALRHAWNNKRLLHADLKPANVLIDSDGTIKLTDFLGLRHGERIPSVFKNWVMGTPEYMSPEQWRAMEGLDARSDMYSLGAMMYHLACGKPPCGDRSPDPHQPFVPPVYEPVEKVRPEFSGEISRLIDRLMAVPVEERFPDWDAALCALEETLPSSMRLNTSQVARPEGKPKEKASKKALLVSLCLLVPVVIILWLMQSQPRESLPVTPLPEEVNGMTSAGDMTTTITVNVPEETETPASPRPAEPAAPVTLPDNGRQVVPPAGTASLPAPPVSTDRRPSAPPARQFDYLEVMSEVFRLARQRSFDEAHDVVKKRLRASPDSIEPYAGRLEEAATLLEQAEAAFRGLAGNAEALIHIELQHTHNHQGRIVALKNNRLHVVREVGQGEVETFPLLRQLADEDLWVLMKAAYGKQAAANLATIMIAEGQVEKAGSFVRMAEIADEETGRLLRRWTELWQRAAMNVRAFSSIKLVNGLIQREQFEEARQTLGRAKQLYRVTDVFTTLHSHELAELDERIEAAIRDRQRDENPRSPPTEHTMASPGPMPTLSPGQLKRSLDVYDGRTVRLLFRARGPIEQPSDNAPLVTRLGDIDDWIEVRVTHENGHRWLRSLPLWDVQAQEQGVYALVRAAENQLDLIGTQKTGHPHQPAFSW